MGEGSNETPWSLEKQNSFRMSSLVQLPEQAQAVSSNVVPVPGSGIFQQFFSPQVHYMQLCSSHISRLSSDVLSPETRPLATIPAGDIMEGFVLPISRMDAAQSYYNCQTSDTLHHLGLSENPFLNQLSHSSSINQVSNSEVNTPFPIIGNMNTESGSNFDKALFLAQNCEASGSVIVPRSDASTEGNSDEGRENTVETHPRESHSREARARSATCDRWQLRRARIAEGVKALQNCIPISDQGKQETVLDDAIDYIKFLKLQLKVLSQSRLSGEAVNYPFVYVEGYGHYLLHEHFCGEPLEEVMGLLIESDMQAALDLLGSKGLSILPMGLSFSLLQTD